jgi:hypothetical protein
MSANVSTNSSQEPSRRSFLVAMGSTILGSFFLPAPASVVGSVLTIADAASDNSAGRVRRLLLWPIWSEDKSTLVWFEKVEDCAKPQVMVWTPKTGEEWAEARRFYAAATWRRWTTLEELGQLLQQPGPWLIRRNFQELYGFLCPTEKPKEIISKIDKEWRFTSDPAEAIRMTSDEVLALIPYLTANGYCKYAGQEAYLEPVKPEEPRKNFRE